MVIYTGSIYHPIFLYAKLMHHLCKAHYSTNFTCDFNWFSISTFSMCTITWKQTCTFMVHSCFFCLFSFVCFGFFRKSIQGFVFTLYIWGFLLSLSKYPFNMIQSFFTWTCFDICYINSKIKTDKCNECCLNNYITVEKWPLFVQKCIKSTTV